MASLICPSYLREHFQNRPFPWRNSFLLSPHRRLISSSPLSQLKQGFELADVLNDFYVYSFYNFPDTLIKKTCEKNINFIQNPFFVVGSIFIIRRCFFSHTFFSSQLKLTYIGIRFIASVTSPWPLIMSVRRSVSWSVCHHNSLKGWEVKRPLNGALVNF